jgi:lysophospholipase L1-like esterase
VDLESYKRNIEVLITHPAMTALHPKIILVTPPPIDEVRRETVEFENDGISSAHRKAAVTAEYAAAVRNIGAEHGEDIAVVDLWTRIMNDAIQNTPGHIHGGEVLGSRALGSNKVLADLLPDGLHLSGRGYKIFYEEVTGVIQERWPQETPENYPTVFPLWRAMLGKTGSS